MVLVWPISTLTAALLTGPPLQPTMDKRKPLASGDELDSGAIKDKTAKIAYLDKLVAIVGVCSGHEINARPSKIVAGLEPEGTNALLAVREKNAHVTGVSGRSAVLHSHRSGCAGK